MLGFISHSTQSTDIDGQRPNHRRQLKQRRRLIDAAYLGGNWRRRPDNKSWDWRGPVSRTTTRAGRASRPTNQSPEGDSMVSIDQSNPYYQESINLDEDTILSDDLLKTLEKPLNGGSVRPRHAFATSRTTGYTQSRPRRVKRIPVR